MNTEKKFVPGFYKTKDGDCAALLFRHEYRFGEKKVVSLYGMLNSRNIWRLFQWGQDGSVSSQGPLPDDLLVEWPDREPVPPGLPKIIFDPEPAKIYSTPKMSDDEYWVKLRQELVIDIFKKWPGELPQNIIRNVNEIIGLLRSDVNEEKK
jgi:hypothetical protein